MVLEKLGESLKSTLSKIAGSIFVDEKLVNELVKDIQRALLQSDVNVKLVFSLSKKIKDRILKEETPGSLTKKEHLVNIVYEELTNFLGEESREIKPDKTPFKIMLVGLFGSGKTTTAGKLGKYFQKRGYKIALISTDTWRPAAFEQLRQTGQKLNIPVFGNPKIKDPVKIFDEFKEELGKFDIIIIDTAGRDALNDELIDELKAINSAVSPDESLLVMSADVGQAAERQAQTFHEHADVKGVIITKLDGTAKGGGALSACAVTGAPVAFIGVGEHVDDLETFNPKRFVGRLLGMGDIEALLDKAKDAITEDKAQDLGNKFLKGKFNLLDLYEQMQAMRKMGPLSKVMDLIPGFGGMKIPKNFLNVQDEKLKKWKHIMDSCTQSELEDPEKVMSPSRMDRIANGSGTSVSQVRELMKQYRQSKKLVKMFGGGNQKNMERMMKRFKGMVPGM